MKISFRYWWAYIWARQYGVDRSTSRQYAASLREFGLWPSQDSFRWWQMTESRRIARCYPNPLP